MQDRHRSPVIIIGAHRSGTTATAHALELLGLQIGQHLDSHREPRGLQKLHEQYLRKMGSSWHNPQAFVNSIETDQGKHDCVSYLKENLQRNFAGIFGYRRNPKGIWMRLRMKIGARW